MSPEQREINRRQRILEHAVSSGNVCLTCRYFGIGRATFYRWKRRYDDEGLEKIKVVTDDKGFIITALTVCNVPGVKQRGISDLAIGKRKIGGSCIYRTRGLHVCPA